MRRIIGSADREKTSKLGKGRRAYIPSPKKQDAFGRHLHEDNSFVS